MKADQSNGTCEVLQYHTYPQMPPTLTHADPPQPTFLLPSPTHDFTSPTPQKQAQPRHRWLPPNCLPVHWWSVCGAWYQTQHLLNHDAGSDRMSTPTKIWPCTWMAISAWLRCPGSFGEARILRKYQYKCLKCLADIYAIVPALGSFSLWQR